MPQNRKRAIILAAAPNKTLPQFPRVTHAFDQYNLGIELDGKNFEYNSGQWRHSSAPLRNVTAREAISDLPPLLQAKSDRKYLHPPQSGFQKLMRADDYEGSKVTHHETKTMSMIINARLALIPKTPGADWKDLPNKVIELPDGTKTVKIKYPYIDYR